MFDLIILFSASAIGVNEARIVSSWYPYYIINFYIRGYSIYFILAQISVIAGKNNDLHRLKNIKKLRDLFFSLLFC